METLEQIDQRLAELKGPDKKAEAERRARAVEIRKLEKARKLAREQHARERAAFLEDDAALDWDHAAELQTKLLECVRGAAAVLDEVEKDRRRWLDKKHEAAKLRGNNSPNARSYLATEWRPGGRLPPDATKADVVGLLTLLRAVEQSFLAYRVTDDAYPGPRQQKPQGSGFVIT